MALDRMEKPDDQRQATSRLRTRLLINSPRILTPPRQHLPIPDKHKRHNPHPQRQEPKQRRRPVNPQLAVHAARRQRQQDGAHGPRGAGRRLGRRRVLAEDVGNVVCQPHEDELEADSHEDAAQGDNGEVDGFPGCPSEPEEGDDHAVVFVLDGGYICLVDESSCGRETYHGDATHAMGSRRYFSSCAHLAPALADLS